MSDMGWSAFVAREEAAAQDACYRHWVDSKMPQGVDPEDYMVEHGIESCEQMPCAVGCPFSRSIANHDR